MKIKFLMSTLSKHGIITIIVTKIVLPQCEKKRSSDREKHFKFETEGREFAKILRSLKQFIRTLKGKNNFW